MYIEKIICHMQCRHGNFFFSKDFFPMTLLFERYEERKLNLLEWKRGGGKNLGQHIGCHDLLEIY